jgi:hypothetical protein
MTWQAWIQADKGLGIFGQRDDAGAVAEGN